MSAQLAFRTLAGAAIAAVAAVFAASLTAPAVASAAAPPAVPAAATTTALSYTIDGSQADTNPADAWKGFGAVSANNTSRYLLDYKDQHPAQYWQIMNELFNPKTGMGLTQVKIELGSDGNTSSGTEPATMRTATDVANVLRGAGFHFAADAKSINPAVQVSLLSWSTPAWVKTNQDRFTWFKDTIDGAWNTYHLPVNWIDPNPNETSVNAGLIDYFGQQLKAQTGTPYDYSKIKIAMDDSNGGIVMANSIITLVNPSSLSAAQQAAALTVPSDPATALAEATDPANSGALWTVSYPGDEDGVAAYYFRVADPELLSDVGALTHHYQIESSPAMSILNRSFGMQIWYSEGVSGIGNGQADEHLGLQSTGQTAIDVADLFVNSYAGQGDATLSNGYPTAVKDPHASLYMFQPAIEAFPTGTTYSSKSDIVADTPWSGDYTNELGYFVTRQFTDFASTGTVTPQQADDPSAVPSGAWQYVDGSASQGIGTESSNSMVGSTADRLTLENPQHTQFSTVVTNNSPNPASYTVTVQNVKLGSATRLAAYETDFTAGASFDSNWFQRDADVPLARQASGSTYTFTFTLAPYSIKTITSLPASSLPAAHRPGDHTAPADSGALDYRTPSQQSIVYQDDFEYAPGSLGYTPNYGPATTAFDYADCGQPSASSAACAPSGPKLSYLDRRGNTPRYSNDMNGAFEVNAMPGGGHALVQQLTYAQVPGAWNPGPPETLIGDDKWANYTASADVDFDTTTAPSPSFTNYVGIGGRADSQGNGFMLVVQADGAWGVLQDPGDAGSVGGGTISASNTLVHGFITGFNDAVTHRIALTMKGETVVAAVDGKTLASWTSSGSNVPLSGRVNLVSGWYHNAFDNLTVSAVPGYAATLSSYIDSGADAVSYSGSWNQSLGSSNILDRTQSIASAGASFTVPFTGTGFALDGSGAQSDHITVAVDGRTIATDVPESSTSNREVGYYATGFSNGRHTLTVTSVDGGLGLNAIAVYGAVTKGVQTGPLATLIGKLQAERLQSGDYSAASWQAYQAALTAAKAAVANPSADEDLITRATAALNSARDGLQAIALQSIADVTVATSVGVAPTLPATVTPVYGTGKGDPVAVTWDTAGLSWNTAGTVVVYGHGTDGNGQPFATAKAVVTIVDVSGVDPASVTVPTGTVATALPALLPKTVQGQLGQTSGRTALPVTWDTSAVTDAQLASTGTLAITGTATTDAGAALPAVVNVILLPEQSYTNVCAQDPGATVTATFTESGYSPQATCDGNTGFTSTDRWSDWQSTHRASDSLTYSFTRDFTVSSATVYSSEAVASSFTVQYLDAAGDWVDTDAGTVTGISLTAPSTATFTPVTTAGIRVNFAFDPPDYTKVNEVVITGTGLAASSVDTLAGLEAGNVPVPGFAPGTSGYSVDATTASSLPVVSAVPTDAGATVSISQATALNPTATVTVTAQDGSSRSYTVDFMTTQQPDYVYYIDSGATSSDTYTKLAATNHLLNAVPDQQYGPPTARWGWDTPDTGAVAGSPSDPNSSYRATFNYYLALPAGTYQVVVGYNPFRQLTALSTVYGDVGNALAPTVSTDITAGSFPEAASTITLGSAQTVALNVVPTSGALNPRIAFVAVLRLPTPPALTSITATGSATSFPLGQPVDLTGLTVTAHYADGSSADVTAGAVLAPIGELATPGRKELTVSYTEGGKTVTAEVPLRVTASSAAS